MIKLKGTTAREYPKGAIETVEQMHLLTGSDIWEVSQGGYLAKRHFTKIASFNEINGVEYEDETFTKKGSFAYTYISQYTGEEYSSGGSLKDYNIGGLNGYNAHFLFFREKDAISYAEFLKGDLEYNKSVKEWHNECRNLFDKWG